MAISINFIVIIIISLGMTGWWARSAMRNLPVIATPAFFWIWGGVTLLALPLLWTTGWRLPTATVRVIYLAGGIILFFTALQVRWQRTSLQLALYGILCTIFIQGVLAWQQVLMPTDAWVPSWHNRIYGSFFQPNVLASYLATGLALTLALTLLPAFSFINPSCERGRQVCLFVLLVMFSALLVLVQSRVGWLAGITVTLLFLWRLSHYAPIRAKLLTLGIIAGVGLGLSLLLSDQIAMSAIDHSNSNIARWRTYSATLDMILERPLLGWGYGGFEYNFQHFRISQTPPTLYTGVVRHPHNEILFWVAEGGIIALAGIALILMGVAYIIRKALRHDRRVEVTHRPLAGVPTALCISLLPIALHSQLEYPFYQSAAHAGVFLLLLAMANRLGESAGNSLQFAKYGRQLAAGMVLVTLTITTTASFSLSGHLALSQVELFGMRDVTPLQKMSPLSRWLNHERVAFDEKVNILLTYNRTHDEPLLTNYRRWAQCYLRQRIDQNIYTTLIAILRHQGYLIEAERYRYDAELLFPAAPPDEPFVNSSKIQQNG